MKEIVVGEGRVVNLKGGSLFQDLTVSLLPDACQADPDPVRGNYEWRQRIPGVFEPDQFGETGASGAAVDGDLDLYVCQYHHDRRAGCETGGTSLATVP